MKSRDFDDCKIRAYTGPWNSCVEILIRDGLYIGEVTMHKKEEGTMIRPTASISMAAAQTLMDDLWNVGIRPTEGTGSAGSLRATEKHLQDMRRIAFNRLKIQAK